MNGMQEAFAAPTAKYKSEVMSGTWGHLAPKPQVEYAGYIVFAFTAWGELSPIAAQFEGLDSSPWFFDDMMDFLQEQIETGDCAEKQGAIYRFTGIYTKMPSGEGRFCGNTVRYIL